MAYSKTEWVNNSTPALNATNLNKIETGIYDLDTIVTSHTATLSILSSTSSSHTASIGVLETDVGTLQDDVVTINNTIEVVQDDIATLDNLVIIRTGTFVGDWTPTFTTTFGITAYNNYNWVCYLNVPSYTVSNGEVLTKTIVISGDNLTFVSKRGTTGVSTQYTLIGYLKANSSYAVVDEV